MSGVPDGVIEATLDPDELKAICAANNVHVGKIIRQPINDLLEFIIKRDAGNIQPVL